MDNKSGILRKCQKMSKPSLGSQSSYKDLNDIRKSALQEFSTQTPSLNSIVTEGTFREFVEKYEADNIQTDKQIKDLTQQVVLLRGRLEYLINQTVKAPHSATAPLVYPQLDHVTSDVNMLRGLDANRKMPYQSYDQPPKYN